MYEYQAKIVSIYDGDTVRCDIDLGFGIEMKNQIIRLWGINTPEIRGESREEGLAARDRLEQIMPIGSLIMMRTKKDRKGKYGRWLGQLYDLKGSNSINQQLVDEGHAISYMKTDS